MKLSISRNQLLATLQSVIGVVERRQTMPILSNVLLKTDGEQLRVTATDLELELVANVAAQVDQPGATTVPARKLLDICRGLPDDSTIQLVQDDEHRIRISSARSRFLLATLPATEFPFLEDLPVGNALEISQQTLKRLLDRTQFAMANQDVRYYLNGLLLMVNEGLVRAVATDGHRLAMCEAATQAGNNDTAKVIVPRKAINELQRLLAPTDTPLTLLLSDNHLQISFPNLQFTTKLIDGLFPDYERVIPKDGDKIVTGDRELVRQALSRTAILSNEKFKGVRLMLEDNCLKLQAQNPDHESAEDEIEVDYGEEPLEIGFNVDYLMDALAVMEADQFILELTGSDSSGLIREQGDNSSKYIVMPMRL